MSHLWWWLSRVWAAPYSLVGAGLGGLVVSSGGAMRAHSGVWEFYGGLAPRLLDLLPLSRVLAITLGHTVIGRDRDALDVTRAHERVHVRQFERWGPLMGPAYLTCSAVIWVRGGDFYRDNPFEREAFAITDPDEPC